MHTTKSTASLHCVVTGANGFIGRSLVPHLEQRGHRIHCWSRKNGLYQINDSNFSTAPWHENLIDVDVVIHLAGVAHQIDADREVTKSQYDLINRLAPVRLAGTAIKAGVKRFIFISSAKVFGEGSSTPYTSSTPPYPQDAYAQSKWNAERELAELTSGSGMELVIIRPPLVYGYEAKANFALLQKLAAFPLPLPFASIENQRDLIAIDNLIDLIETCLQHPAAPTKVWLCADAHPYSLPDLITELRAARAHRPALFKFPQNVLKRIVSALIGIERSEKMLGNFRLDCVDTNNVLGWHPRVSMHEVFATDPKRRSQ